MWLIVLEAVVALAVLVFVVWWTMFSGRRGGEIPPEDAALPAPRDHGDQDDDRGGSRKLKG